MQHWRQAFFFLTSATGFCAFEYPGYLWGSFNFETSDLDSDGLRAPHELKRDYEIVLGAFTWHEAKAEAERRGGYLATFNVPLEFLGFAQDYLGWDPRGVFQRHLNLWLGGTDESKEGTWKWLEPYGEVEFTEPSWQGDIPWRPGEPNNNHLGSPAQGDPENYLMLWWVDGTYALNDARDDGGLLTIDGFVLEKGPRPTHYIRADLDGDGLNDGQERTLGTEPWLPDTDGDGLNDGSELAHKTNPRNFDTDGDGKSDGDEVNDRQDPLEPILPGGVTVKVSRGIRMDFDTELNFTYRLMEWVTLPEQSKEWQFTRNWLVGNGRRMTFWVDIEPRGTRLFRVESLPPGYLA